jgi:hypothetical protein
MVVAAINGDNKCRQNGNNANTKMRLVLALLIGPKLLKELRFEFLSPKPE